MVLKIEQLLGSKVSLRIFRYLLLRPYGSIGLTGLSDELKISKSNILRIMQILVKDKIIIEVNEKRKKVYRANESHSINRKLFEIFMIEKQYNIEPRFKNIIDMVFSELKDKVEMFIVFGSVAYGMQGKDSDIDICVIGPKNLAGLRFDYLPNKVEIHTYSKKDFFDIKDFVVLESLMHGIWYKGDVFGLLSRIDSIPKAYVVYRLNKAKQFLKKNNPYFRELAKITLGEIDSLLHKKKTVPRKKINIKPTQAIINKIENIIAKEGDKIWIS